MSKRWALALGVGLALICAGPLTGCALKGSKAEAKYEGRSECSDPHFTCGRNAPGLNSGLEPSVTPDQDQTMPTFHAEENNYAPLCKLKNNKCVCACEPVP